VLVVFYLVEGGVRGASAELEPVMAWVTAAETTMLRADLRV
jgi:hypothetical protein